MGEIDKGVRLLDAVQRSKRVRLVTWAPVQVAIDRVKAGIQYMGVDGGSVHLDYAYPASTTLVIVALNSAHQIVMGATRCEALKENIARGIAFHIYNQEDMNRGSWYRLTGFSVYDWANAVPDVEKVIIHG